jgi:hypothetical protein
MVGIGKSNPIDRKIELPIAAAMSISTNFTRAREFCTLSARIHSPG